MGRGRKLYYDVTLTGDSPSVVVPLTQVTAGTPPDRRGAYLDTLPGLPPTASGSQRQRQEVTAVFVPYSAAGGEDFMAVTSNGGFFTLTDGPVWIPSPPPTSFVLTFDENINPLTVIDGTTIQHALFNSSNVEIFDEYAPYDISVVANIVTVTPLSNGFADLPNLNARLRFTITTGLESVAGHRLAETYTDEIRVLDDQS